MDGNADVDEIGVALVVDTDVVGERRRRRQLVVGQPVAEAPLDSSRMPSGPKSSTMNFIRAFTREIR